jgi:AcrR family transcriptional regulator
MTTTAAGREEVPTSPFSGTHRRPRERLLAAVLEVSGELGYEQVSVKPVLERAGASRGSFYNHFKDKDDCYFQAYEEASNWLYLRVQSVAGRSSSWREAFRASVAELLHFCAEQPAMARAIFIEPHAAGGRALEQHDRLMARFADGVDLARTETGSKTSPPAMTASFMVGAIETLIADKISKGEAEDAPELLPGILHLVVMQYYGKEAAWEEMTAATLATWDAKHRVFSEAS